MIVEVADRPAFAYTGGKPFDPALPLVVFVHGASHDHSVWIMQSRYLAHHGYSVLAVDLPGHGRSAGEPLATVAELADWVLALVVAVRQGVDASAPAAPVYLVGHSMGSLIALEAAGRPAGGATARVPLAGLVLVATAVPMKVSDALLEAADHDEARAFDMINVWSYSGLTHLPGMPGPGFSVFVQNRRLMERQRAGVLATDFRACNAYADGIDRARNCQLPVLLLLGGADQMTPVKATRALTAALPRSETVVIDGAGHAVMHEQPDRVLAALKSWLGSR